MNKKGITGIVLAGGKSSRMGSDKGLVDLNGRKLIEHVLSTLIPLVDNIIIVANSDHYGQFGCKVYPDIFVNRGPMGGIYTGLLHSTTYKNLILSCDMPFVTGKLLSYIISQSDNSQITIPLHNAKTEPLCAVYHKNCSKTFLELLEKNQLKMQDALKCFNTKTIELSGLSIFTEKVFTNINTKQELELYADRS